MKVERTARAPRRRGRPEGLYKAVRCITVPAYTHTRVLRIQRQYGFERMGDVVELVTRGLK